MPRRPRRRPKRPQTSVGRAPIRWRSGCVPPTTRAHVLPFAAPAATISGESSVIMPLGSRVPGRRRKVVTREPGDLPSVVVTREHVGRGVLTVAEPARTVVRAGETSFAVTCHNVVAPEVSYHVLHHKCGSCNRLGFPKKLRAGRKSTCN